MYSGYQTHMLFKKETTFGTEVTADTILGRNVSWTANSDIGIIEERGAGEGPDVKIFNRGRYKVSGTLTFNLINFDFFECIIGTRTGSGTSGDPYVYTGYDSSGNWEDLPSFTLEQAYDSSTDMNYTIIGAKVESATINIPKNGVITVSVNFRAVDMKIDSTIQSYTASSTPAWTFVQAKFERNNVKIDYVQSATISITNSLLAVDEINSIKTTNLIRGDRTYSSEITAYLDSSQISTLLTDHFGQSPASGPTAGSITGETIDVELTDGASRNVTISMLNSAVSLAKANMAGVNDLVSNVFTIRPKKMTITEQIS